MVRSLVIQVKAAQVAPTGTFLPAYLSTDGTTNLKQSSLSDFLAFSVCGKIKTGKLLYLMKVRSSRTLITDSLAFNELKRNAEQQHKESEMFCSCLI